VNREEELFAQLLGLPAADRPAELERLCAGDAALRRRLTALLQADGEADDFLEVSPVAAAHPGPPAAAAAAEQPGARLGRYKLLQKIGEGGCGIVYMAEQEEPVRRRVALKVIKLGMDTKAVIARFEAERQALALMDHPAIARVFDGGTTAQGRPYFVMELVRGVRITDFCNQNNLTTTARLELFLQVCHAIHHAHQKGVIHRDIKPSNILVTVNDGVALPKVIDFGIAKATQGRLTERTLFTAFEQFIGTPAYMSPEQAEMSSLDVDTRSDIYSLGVLLYELLTGLQPFDAKALSQGGIDALRRTIREVEPPRPSARLRTLPGAEQATVARQRGLGPAQLVSTLCGDLDWIVMKALEKNRSRRYETVNALTADLGRHLRHEPVLARPPSVLYRFGKLVRRQPLATATVAALAATMLVAVAGPAGVAVSMVVVQVAIAAALLVGLAVSRARMQRARRAEHEQAQMAAFLRRFVRNLVLLGAVDGDKQLLGRYLDVSAQELADELPSQPEMKAEFLETLGSISLSIGQYASAETKLARALELRRQSQGASHPDVGRSLNYLGLVLSAAGKLPEAERTLREARDLQVRLGDAGLPDLARTLGNLGWVLMRQGQLPGAESYLAEALALQRPAGASADLALSLKRLGFVHLQAGRIPESIEELTEARDMNVHVLGHDHLEVASSLNFLGVAYAVREDRPTRVLEAIKLYVEASAIRERLKSSGGAASADRLNAMLSQQGTLAEIESLLLELRKYTHAHQPRDTWQQAYFRALSAVVLLEEKRFAEAEAAARECLALRQAARPEDWGTFHAQCMWGAALAGLRDYAAAEEPLRAGYEGMRLREATIPPPHRLWLGRALQDLAAFCRDTGRADEAARWQVELQRWAEGHPELARILQRTAHAAG
jgi:tetratricopeptide (TPR) repeat protein